MKKILSIILLAVFLFNTMGVYVVFKVNQSMIRSDTRAMINSGFHKELYLLVRIDNPGSDPNFKKLDHNEFSYQGQLYDIVSESVKGSTIWYYCIHDKHEERLIDGFEKIQSFPSSPGSPRRTNHLLALVLTHISLALINDQTVLVNPGPSDHQFCQYLCHPVKTDKSPFPPPPKFS